MVRVRPADLLFWIMASLAMLFVVAFLLVLFGGVAIESSGETTEAARTTETKARPATPAPKPVEAPRTTPKTTTPKTTARAVTPAQKPAALVTVVLTAARGDCWIQAREGSADGRILDERILSEGETLSLQSERVWLALGAAGNLDITVNGKPQQLTPGTISVVLGGKGS